MTATSTQPVQADTADVRTKWLSGANLKQKEVTIDGSRILLRELDIEKSAELGKAENRDDVLQVFWLITRYGCFEPGTDQPILEDADYDTFRTRMGSSLLQEIYIEYGKLMGVTEEDIEQAKKA